MTRRRRFPLQLLGWLAGLCMAAPLNAWDTRVEQGYPVNSWLSIYQSGRGVSWPEHTTLSDIALQELGLYPLFGRKGSAQMTLVDLNASVFRERQLLGTPRKGDDGETTLEERLIPPPAHFSGLPDYSYTLYDWLNKNALCPALPEQGANEPQNCHVFALGWLGDLNSIHFGSQAAEMYSQLHFLALRHASWAHDLRVLLRRENEATRRHWSLAVKEAELLALAYEGYAQHFLQDRWALGHMWERWSAPDYAQLPLKAPLRNHITSAIAGLLHGSEALVGERRGVLDARGDALTLDLPVIGKLPLAVDPAGYLNAADPMSSPLFVDGKVVPLRWIHDSYAQGDARRGPFPGAGDERLNDIRAGFFGASYHAIGRDYPFAVDQQWRQMLECSKAGWAEVVRGFDFRDGQHGEWGAVLAANAPTFDVLRERRCWDQWATNEAMFQGLVNDQLSGVLLDAEDFARLALKATAFVSELVQGEQAVVPRADLTDLYYRIWRARRNDPNGVDLAQGGIGKLQGFKPGNAYQLPEYVEPLTRLDLPSNDGRGRDRQTVFGVFNRANADHWCQQLPNQLERLRHEGQQSPRRRMACEYLASMAYQGTLVNYEGPRRERRQDEQGNEVRSICLVHRQDESVDNDDNPIWLDPGYVAKPQQPAQPIDNHPSERYGYQSIRDWCGLAPVLRLSIDSELAREHVVQVLDDTGNEFEIRGYNLGNRPGRLNIESGAGFSPGPWRIKRWENERIVLVADVADWKKGDYPLTLRTHDGRDSVGLFRLRADPSPEPIVEIQPLVLSGRWPCGPPTPGMLSTIRLAGDGLKDDAPLTAGTLAALLEQVNPPLDGIVAAAERESACVRQIQHRHFESITRPHRRPTAIAPRALGMGGPPEPTPIAGSVPPTATDIDLSTPELDNAAAHLAPIYRDFELELHGLAELANRARRTIEAEIDRRQSIDRRRAAAMERHGVSEEELRARHMASTGAAGGAPAVPLPSGAMAHTPAELGRMHDMALRQNLSRQFEQLNAQLELMLRGLGRWRAFDRYARTLLAVVYEFEGTRARAERDSLQVLREKAEIQARIVAMRRDRRDESEIEPLTARMRRLEDKYQTDHRACWQGGLIAAMAEVVGGSGPYLPPPYVDVPSPAAAGFGRVSGHWRVIPADEKHWAAVQRGLQLPGWAATSCSAFRGYYAARIAPQIGQLLPEVEPIGADPCSACAARGAQALARYGELRLQRGLPYPLPDPADPSAIPAYQASLGQASAATHLAAQHYDNCLRQCRGYPPKAITQDPGPMPGGRIPLPSAPTIQPPRLPAISPPARPELPPSRDGSSER